MSNISLNSIFAYIEGIDFVASLGLINDVHSLFGFVEGDANIKSLIIASRADVNIGHLVCDRMALLLDTETEKDTLHRYDRTIAVYLAVLYMSNQDAVKRALKMIYDARDKVPNLWWAFIIYNKVLSALPRRATFSARVDYTTLESIQPFKKIEHAPTTGSADDSKMIYYRMMKGSLCPR